MIDFHVHHMPEDAGLKTVKSRFGEFSTRGFWKRLVDGASSLSPPMNPGTDLTSRILAWLRKAGIRKLVFLAQNSRENAALESFCRNSPEESGELIFVPFFNADWLIMA